MVSAWVARAGQEWVNSVNMARAMVRAAARAAKAFGAGSRTLRDSFLSRQYRDIVACGLGAGAREAARGWTGLSRRGWREEFLFGARGAHGGGGGDSEEEEGGGKKVAVTGVECALAEAAAVGDGEAVRALLSAAAGCDVNGTDTDGRTALWWAARRGDMEMVQTLLRVPGVDLNKVDAYEQSALLHASAFGHYEVAIALIKAGAEAPRPASWAIPPDEQGEAEDEWSEETIRAQIRAKIKKIEGEDERKWWPFESKQDVLALLREREAEHSLANRAEEEEAEEEDAVFERATAFGDGPHRGRRAGTREGATRSGMHHWDMSRERGQVEGDAQGDVDDPDEEYEWVPLEDENRTKLQ